MIVGSQNKLIKKIASLKQKKYRDELNLFCVEGIRLVKDAFLSGWPIQMCVFETSAKEKERIAAFLEKLEKENDNRQNKILLIEVSKETYAKITDTKEPQGIMLVLEKRSHCLDTLLGSVSLAHPPKIPLVAVLDGVNDPGNAGTIIRTAAAAGCIGAILLKGSADVFNGKTLRAAMGATFHIPVVEDIEQNKLIAALEKNGVSLLAATLSDDARIYYKQNLTIPLAVAFGNEGGGLSHEILSFAAEKIYIPINSLTESLNVSVAAGIILYEATRQQSLS
jgi:TrmH family RNA methyltransferase